MPFHKFSVFLTDTLYEITVASGCNLILQNFFYNLPSNILKLMPVDHKYCPVETSFLTNPLSE